MKFTRYTKHRLIGVSKKLIQGLAKRRNSTYEKDKTIQNLKSKVKMYDNFNRRLKRKIASTPVSLLSEEISGHSIDDNAPSTSISSVVLDCVSPSSKKRAIKRLKLHPWSHKCWCMDSHMKYCQGKVGRAKWE